MDNQVVSESEEYKTLNLTQMDSFDDESKCSSDIERSAQEGLDEIEQRMENSENGSQKNSSRKNSLNLENNYEISVQEGSEETIEQMENSENGSQKNSPRSNSLVHETKIEQESDRSFNGSQHSPSTTKRNSISQESDDMTNDSIWNHQMINQVEDEAAYENVKHSISAIQANDDGLLAQQMMNGIEEQIESSGNWRLNSATHRDSNFQEDENMNDNHVLAEQMINEISEMDENNENMPKYSTTSHQHFLFHENENLNSNEALAQQMMNEILENNETLDNASVSYGNNSVLVNENTNDNETPGMFNEFEETKISENGSAIYSIGRDSVAHNAIGMQSQQNLHTIEEERESLENASRKYSTTSTRRVDSLPPNESPELIQDEVNNRTVTFLDAPVHRNSRETIFSAQTATPWLDQKVTVMPLSNSNDLPEERYSCCRSIFILAICFICGIWFGFVMEKSRVFEPENIRLQLVFEKWILMKMFLAAMATTLISFGLLSLIPLDFVEERFLRAQNRIESVLKSRNILSVIIGSIILGIGMGLDGSCPGMELPQIGAWTKHSIFTFAGSLLGNLAYGLLHDRLYEKVFPPDRFYLPTTLPEWTHMDFGIISLPLGLLLFFPISFLEYWISWKSDLDWQWLIANPNTTTVFEQVAWPPSLCGVFIGSLQIILVLLDSRSIGGSGAYNTLTSQVAFTSKLQQLFPYLAKKRCGVGNWWMVIFLFGGIFGGAFSALLSGTWGKVPGVPIPFAFCGGFLLLFGARLAAGCTSGHGLSGSGFLFLASFVAVPCIFAGAIPTAFILKMTDQLYLS